MTGAAILVINSGSSSLKYQLIDVRGDARLATGLIERIGEASGRVRHRAAAASSVSSASGATGVTPGAERVVEYAAHIADHADAFAHLRRAFADAGTPLETVALVAVGHRVVQGGSEFIAPTLIDDAVAARILALAPLAPLHNPGHYQAIVAARRVFTEVPHVAVFDTAFHQTMPPEAATYAIDAKLASGLGIRRYGFHGTSHQVVSRRAAQCAGVPLDQAKQIVLHLGNGASACAVLHGRSVDTSMGFTPLQGLVMGTRSGDIDPSVIAFLVSETDMDVAAVTELLNHRSGLLGLAGSNDMRDVQGRADAGDPFAQLALRVYAHRIRHYLGAYMVTLGGLDLLSFTAGVGENSPAVRELVCRDLAAFGIELDPARNHAEGDGARVISADRSRVTVLVVPTDEELEIAHQAHALVQA